VLGGREVRWSGVRAGPRRGKVVRGGAATSDTVRQLAKQSELPSSDGDVICPSGPDDGALGPHISIKGVVVK
jgi:hypothetical protein